MTVLRAPAAMAAVIINHNTRQDLEACLETVFAEGAAEVVVVDNASTDGSPQMVTERFPAARLLENRVNPGYGAASNQGIAACAAPYALLLNSDTLLPAGTLAALSRYLDDHPQAGLAGPRLLNADGTLQPSCFPFPTPAITFLRATIWGSLAGRIPGLRDRYLFTWAHDRDRAVPWVMGAALALRRTAFDAVGGFDPSYFMYAEETDLCYRLWQEGYEVHFTPAAGIVHLGGSSTSQRRQEMEIQRYAATRHFYRVHYSSGQQRQLRALMLYSMARNIARDRLRLALAHDAARRPALANDIAVWRGVMADTWRQGTATARHHEANVGALSAPESEGGTSGW